MKKLTLLKNILHWIFCIIIISIPALYNNYPLLYADSGTYMDTSFSLTPPIDRTIGYGLFIRLVTWQASMWPVVFIQSAIIVKLIFDIISVVIGNVEKKYQVLVCFIMFIGSSLCWYSNQIMPDIFTGILGCCIFLFLFEKKKLIHDLFYIIIFLIAIVSHTSHIAIFALIFITLLVVKICFLKKYFEFSFKKLLLLFTVYLIGITFLLSNNFSNGNGYTLNPSSNVFFAARLAESGLIKKYYQLNPNDSSCKIYKYRDSLPLSAMTFLWDMQGPLYKSYQSTDFVATWKMAEKDLSVLNKKILTTPSLLSIFIWKASISTIAQVFMVGVGSGIEKYGEGSSCYWPINAHLPNELSEFLNSRQNRGFLDFTYINLLNIMILFSSIIIIYFFWKSKNTSHSWKVFVFFCVILLFYNAFSTGGLANVYDRLQARVTWPLVLAAIIAIVNELINYKKTIKNEK